MYQKLIKLIIFLITHFIQIFVGISFRGVNNSQFHRMRELVGNGPPVETCCHRSYSSELAFDFNKDKIHENEVLGKLMKHQYIQKMFMHLVYHFHGILVNQLYTCT